MSLRDVGGRIFDIQRNSYVDGPGLRTAVFFKGCNLRCLWCHNPEGLSFDKQYAHFADSCSSCGQCASICPNGALSAIGVPDKSKCMLCGKCQLYCPKSAIRVYGRDVTAGEMLDLIVKDRAFYETSGGGVTFTGGECMLQFDFLHALLALCAEAGVHTAVDTAGNAPPSVFERIEPYADAFLYDVKAINPLVHKRLTGTDNALILSNLRWLLAKCPEKVYIRIPVIPGANYDENGGEIPLIADFLRGQSAPQAIELLPYHQLGDGKRRALGIAQFVSAAPGAARMAALNALF